MRPKGPRIVAGTWRGRTLTAPPGDTTRPTADRVRQALFDMLLHAPWGGRDVLEDASVLDAFAGTGALGLEALSRGAAFAHFMESDRSALTALRANIGICGGEARCRVVAGDTLQAPRGEPCSLVFLDPPYGRTLVVQSLARLGASGWLAPKALIVAEVGREETLALPAEVLADRSHGAARLQVWRMR